MTENQALKDDQEATALNLLRCNLSDQIAHEVSDLVALGRSYQEDTADGQLLFGPAGKQIATIVRNALKKLVKAGEVKFDSARKKVRLLHAPPWKRGRTQILRDAEAKAKNAIIAVIENGGGRPITELQESAQNAIAPLLKDVIGAGGAPSVLPFALIRRVIDGLVEQAVIDRSYTPHEGEQIEILTKHEEKEKRKRGKKAQSPAAESPGQEKATDSKSATVAATEAEPAIDLTLTEKDKADYSAAFGIPAITGKGSTVSPTLAEALVDVAPVLAEVAWANAPDQDRRRFLAEQLAHPEVIARVRTTLSPVEKAVSK